MCLAPSPLFFSVSALAADNSIAIAADHLKNLGIVLGKPEPVTQIPLLTAPAKVVVPPSEDYLVSASQSGLITRLHASIGETVKKGQVLAELNSPDLLTLQREYLKAESALQLGSLVFRRDKKLFEEGVIPERRWQETASQYHAFMSEASEHRQLLEIAGMTDAEIEQLKNTHRLSGQLQVRSPIAGTVMERMAVAGSRVDVLAPLYRIADLSELWLEISVPQERAAEVKIGDSVELENVESQDGAAMAKIGLLSQNVNPENQTVLARAVIKGKQPAIRPGQRINIRIIRTAEKPAYRVPNTAIAQHEGHAYLFIRSATGFNVAPVDVIGKQGESSIVGGNLAGTEDIAVKGAVALKATWLGLGSDE
ncbi:efflux RND transporter periplasmic adaptor subunit [Methylomicrobium sp. RS1]|uniref:efflux RND transporter periplasmic adaptor subunit n=1 Tax=Candidatus Methylomicrobium oryzae TaxID=2802053 RepID=UPI00301692AA